MGTRLVVKLELTESALVQNSEAVDAVFRQLKALGVKLYLDDFGTGYSSLSYLQRFPVDALKIDRSFVHHMTVSPESTELIKTILAMSQTLNLGVVAEGIETEAQRARLAALGCTYAQGYLFAQPLGVDEATAFLKATRKTARRSGAVQLPQLR